jgi:hypothetical protein
MTEIGTDFVIYTLVLVWLGELNEGGYDGLDI